MVSPQAEYESLRQEILDERSREFSVVNFGYTVAAGIISFAFLENSVEPVIFILPLIVLYLTLVQINNLLVSSITKAVYIQIAFEEENPNLNWENFISKNRRQIRQKQSPWKVLFSSSNLIWMTSLLGFVCILLCYYFNNQASSSIDVNIIHFVFVVWAFASLNQVARNKHAISTEFENSLKKEVESILNKEVV